MDPSKHTAQTSATAAAARDGSLDALRGFSVLAMVLSGSLAFGAVLPAWMFHAQVPPPLHIFTPARVGITWVDLVFPFFLFAMGAAMPMALQGATASRALSVAARRYFLLMWLALFSQHMKAGSLSTSADATTHALALSGFVLLGLQLAPGTRWLRMAAWLVAVLLLFGLPFRDGRGFDAARSDIILVVLANMALFATPIWWLTRQHPWWRLAVLPLVGAVLLGASVAGSWNAWLFKATPLAWAYKFLFLKYLFIVLPATFVGEWMLRERQATAAQQAARGTFSVSAAASDTADVPPWVGAFAIALVCVNTWLLFVRALLPNLLLTVATLSVLLWLTRRLSAFVRKTAAAGGGLLLLGLACEALEGGIRKDPSTFSYYFVTGGLACMALLSLRAAAGSAPGRVLVDMLATQGRNPLLAYVAGALCLLPLLHLTGLHPYWAAMNGNPWEGFAKGLVFTAAVATLTAVASARAWTWKA